MPSVSPSRLAVLALAVLLLAPAVAGCLTAEDPGGSGGSLAPVVGEDGQGAAVDGNGSSGGASPGNRTPAADPGSQGEARVPAGNASSANATLTWRSNLQRWGYLEGALAPRAVELAWKVQGINKGEHTAAKGSPLFVEDSLLVAGDTGILHRFSLNGSVRWSAATHPSGFGIHGTPAVHDGVVYIGAYDGALYAFDLGTGELHWRTVLGGSIGSSPAYHEGLVYVSVETPEPSGIMSIVNATTGELVWEDTRLTDHPHSSVALDPQRGVFAVGANNGAVYAWDLETRQRLWIYWTPGAIKGPVMLYDGAVFAASWDDKLHRVNLTTGEADWTFRTDGRLMGGPAVDPATDLVYVGSFDDHLYAVDASTGEEVWSQDLGGWVIASPVVAGELVLAGSYDEHLYALDKATGEVVWRFKGGGRVTGSAAVQGDLVAFTERADERTGHLYLLRGTDGPGGPPAS